MRNRFYADLRASKRRLRALEESLVGDSQSSHSVQATDMIDLSNALWKLTPQYREALVLVGAGGFSYEEAAALCGCAVGTMKARVSRARRLLAEHLG